VCICNRFEKEISMSNLRVFDPFAVDTVDDVLRRFLRPSRLEGMPEAPQIRLDVQESDNAYQVKAELPGVKKEDIHVSVDGNYVNISGEVKQEKDEKKDGKVLRSERYFGSVSRAFSLASEVDDSAVVAKLDNGVLSLTLPKKAAAQAKRINIE